MFNKSWRWLDSNPGSPLSEATALSTLPQPQPIESNGYQSFLKEMNVKNLPIFLCLGHFYKCWITYNRELLLLKQLFQCDQIGRFLKFLATEFLAKVAQIFSNNFGLLWKMDLFTVFWATFVDNWATFCSNIWSHWTLWTNFEGENQGARRRCWSRYRNNNNSSNKKKKNFYYLFLLLKHFLTEGLSNQNKSLQIK